MWSYLHRLGKRSIASLTVKDSSRNGKANFVDVAIFNKIFTGRIQLELGKEMLRSKVILTLFM